MDGWIKIHRKITKWEWWTDVNTSHLFLHLLLHANYEAGRWQGRDILPGQLVIGRKSLALSTGLSEQQIRTALERLKSTNEITSEIYRKFTVITIINWLDYQEINQISNHEITTNQPRDNHEITTIEERKKVRKKEYNPLPPLLEEPKTEYDEKLEQFIEHRKAMRKKMTPQAIKLLKRKLNNFHAKGYDVLEMIDTAIERGWQTVYPPKEDAA